MRVTGYQYSKVSQERIAECHPDIQAIMAELIQWADVAVFCGHRGEAEQNQAFLENKSKLKFPLSKHNSVPSMAIDIGPYFIDVRNTDWNDRLAFARLVGRVDQIADQLLKSGAISHAVTWGGDWDNDGRSVDHKFLDLPHLELRALP